MRSSCINRVGPKYNDMNHYKKRNTVRRGDMQGRSHMKIEAEAGIVPSLGPMPRNPWGHQKLEEPTNSPLVP